MPLLIRSQASVTWHTANNVKISSHLHTLLPDLDPIPLMGIIVTLEWHPLALSEVYIAMKFVE